MSSNTVPWIQNFFTSRDNNANASSYVGQEGRLWYDPITNAIYVSDGQTAGGILVSGGGGGVGPKVQLDGGAADSVYLAQDQINGGSASSVYSSGQIINGGFA
jgi:hypothetical protein